MQLDTLDPYATIDCDRLTSGNTVVPFMPPPYQAKLLSSPLNGATGFPKKLAGTITWDAR